MEFEIFAFEDPDRYNDSKLLGYKKGGKFKFIKYFNFQLF